MQAILVSTEESALNGTHGTNVTVLIHRSVAGTVDEVCIEYLHIDTSRYVT